MNGRVKGVLVVLVVPRLVGWHELSVCLCYRVVAGRAFPQCERSNETVIMRSSDHNININTATVGVTGRRTGYIMWHLILMITNTRSQRSGDTDAS